MNNTFYRQNAKMRLLSFTLALCLVITAVTAFGTTEAHAATKTVKVTKVKFSKSSVNVTLGKQTSSLTITINKKVNKANRAEITLKSEKKSQRIIGSVKGKKITATLTADTYATPLLKNLTQGKWKVTKVVLKKAKMGKKYEPGKWDGAGVWHPGYYYSYLKSTKTLASGISKVKKYFTVKCGKETKLTVTAPSSAYAKDGLSLSAKLTADGKAMAGRTVSFYLSDGSGGRPTPDSPGNYSRKVYSAATDASGVARINVPKDALWDYTFVVRNDDLRNYWCIAEYKGEAAKYRPAWATPVIGSLQLIGTAITAKFVSWDGMKGKGHPCTFKATVKDANGKPVAGVGLRVYVDGDGPFSGFDYGSYYLDEGTPSVANIMTGADGTVTITDQAPEYSNKGGGDWGDRDVGWYYVIMLTSKWGDLTVPRSGSNASTFSGYYKNPADYTLNVAP